MRHWYASGLIEAGCDVVTIQKAMGHASASTTLSTYAWLWPGVEVLPRRGARGLIASVFTPEHTRSTQRAPDLQKTGQLLTLKRNSTGLRGGATSDWVQPASRTVGLLDSAAYRPQSSLMGQDAYPTLHEGAAVLLESVVRNHSLVDGNGHDALLDVDHHQSGVRSI
jgi:hypothetical protein